MGSEWIWREPDKAEGVILSEPRLGERGSRDRPRLDGEKVFSPEMIRRRHSREFDSNRKIEDHKLFIFR